MNTLKEFLLIYFNYRTLLFFKYRNIYYRYKNQIGAKYDIPGAIFYVINKHNFNDMIKSVHQIVYWYASSCILDLSYQLSRNL